jgi:hypothetical protein
MSSTIAEREAFQQRYPTPAPALEVHLRGQTDVFNVVLHSIDSFLAWSI